jgi:hypothetical protein
VSDIPARTIKVKIVTGGGVDDTDVVDADTGERLRFALPDGTVATYTWHMLFQPGLGGIGKVALVLDNVPVEAPGVVVPVEIYGVTDKKVDHAAPEPAAD